MVRRRSYPDVESVSYRTLQLRDLRSRAFGRLVVSPLLVCDWSAPLSSTQNSTPELQRVSEPLDLAYRGRIHFRDRLTENYIACVARAVDGPAVHAHTGRQEHLVIFQALVPQGV